MLPARCSRPDSKSALHDLLNDKVARPVQLVAEIHIYANLCCAVLWRAVLGVQDWRVWRPLWQHQPAAGAG